MFNLLNSFVESSLTTICNPELSGFTGELICIAGSVATIGLFILNKVRPCVIIPFAVSHSVLLISSLLGITNDSFLLLSVLLDIGNVLVVFSVAYSIGGMLGLTMTLPILLTMLDLKLYPMEERGTSASAAGVHLPALLANTIKILLCVYMVKLAVTPL